MLSFFPQGVLDEILNLIESVSEDFPSYSSMLPPEPVTMLALGLLLKLALHPWTYHQAGKAAIGTDPLKVRSAREFCPLFIKQLGPSQPAFALFLATFVKLALCLCSPPAFSNGYFTIYVYNIVYHVA